MICFKDSTFCPFYKECADPCDRALTDEVKKAAQDWWPDHAYISQYIDKPHCFKEKEVEILDNTTE